MSILSKAIRVAAVGGMVAGTFAIGSGSASAAPTNVGTCTNIRALATAKSTFIWPGDGKAAGLTDKNHDVALSAKGVNFHGQPTNFGSCTFLAPVTGGTKAISKWSAKLTSPVADCVADNDAAEYPQNGKVSITFADLTKLDGYMAITETNPNLNGLDTVGLHGIVTKGIAVGSFIDGEVWYNPVVKDKTQLNDWNGTPSILNDQGVYPGYGYDLANAGGCQAVTEPPVEASNLRAILIGDGPSQLLGSPAAGLSFSHGA